MSHRDRRTQILRDRLAEAGLAPSSVSLAGGGIIAVAGLATLAGGARVFAKTVAASDADLAAIEDLFPIEAEGLRALARLGGVNTPAVRYASARLLVLDEMLARRDDAAFWERLGRMVAGLHTTTGSDRFGWHRDGWLGRLRQDNTWDGDGHAFFAQRRILRWLAEPLVAEAFDQSDRRALERLCARLPELIPAHLASLTHGDLWSGNILADRAGLPVLIDPAVSYTWPEVDLSMLWCSPRPPCSDRFFAVYEEAAAPAEGWRDWAPILQLREILSVVAHGDDDWGAVAEVRRIIAPFRKQ
jgi:fructosamine-3-kinase